MASIGRVAVLLVLLAAACVEQSEPAPTTTLIASPSTSAPATTSASPSTSTFDLDAFVATITTLGPTAITEFTTSVCDPDLPDPQVQVVQAFVAAYNDRDMEALLAVFQPVDIFDISGLPHLGHLVEGTDATLHDPEVWAEAGWAVDDRFELTVIYDYGGGGSEIVLERFNRLLAKHDLDGLEVFFKVQSRGCVIGRLVGGHPTGPLCRDFISAFVKDLQGHVGPLPCPSTAADGVVYEVIGIGTELPFHGFIEHLTVSEPLPEVWGYYQLPDPVPIVDFDTHFLLIYVKAEDACSDDLTLLELVDGRLIPTFVPPPGGCIQPLIRTSYAVAVDRRTVPDSFTVVLPAFAPESGAGYEEVEHQVDLTTDYLPDMP